MDCAGWKHVKNMWKGHAILWHPFACPRPRPQMEGAALAWLCFTAKTCQDSFCSILQWSLMHSFVWLRQFRRRVRSFKHLRIVAIWMIEALGITWVEAPLVGDWYCNYEKTTDYLRPLNRFGFEIIWTYLNHFDPCLGEWISPATGCIPGLHFPLEVNLTSNDLVLEIGSGWFTSW